MDQKSTIIIIGFSLFVIVFSLGMAKSLLIVPVHPVSKDASIFKSKNKDNLKRLYFTKEEHGLLYYGKPSEILFTDNSIKAQGLPLKVIHFKAFQRVEKVKEWYLREWKKKGLIVLTRDKKDGCAIESLNIKTKQFLNVQANYRRDKGAYTEVIATVLDIRAPKSLISNEFQITSQKTMVLESEGEIPGGDSWKRKVYLYRQAYPMVIKNIINDYTSKPQWVIESIEKEDKRCLINLVSRDKIASRFCVFQPMNKGSLKCRGEELTVFKKDTH